MNKILFVLICFNLFFFTTVSGEDSDYLENVRLDPDHGEINREGEIDILFNLPDHALVKRAYISFNTGTSEITMPSSSVEGSDLGYLNNKITIKGSEIEDILNGIISPVFSYTGNTGVRNNYDYAEDPDTDLYETDSDVTTDVDAEENDEDIYVDDNDTETDDTDNDTDNDPDSVSANDGVYSFKLIIELDNTAEEEETTGDIFEDETDDEDETPSTTVPASVTSSFSIVFDNTPPSAPHNAETEGGDKRVVLIATPPLKEGSETEYEKIGKYHIVLSGIFDRDGDEVETSLEYITSVKGQEYDADWKVSLSGKDGLELINNDDNLEKYVYSLTISAEDVAGNHDPEKWIKTSASAITTFGFWSHYKTEGGKEDGGFCFIASAGFGSYNHHYVKILRNFRDIYLEKFGLGKYFIKQYYSLGHYPAHLIEKHPVFKPAIKVFLFPFVLTAWLFTDSIGFIILSMWLFIFSFTFLRKRRNITVSIFLFAMFFYFPSSLKALDGEFSFTNSFYHPSKIDSGLESDPFKTIGGTEQRYLPSITFGLKIPLLEKYIRWSVVTGIGFTRFKGTSIKADGEKSMDSTKMYFIPTTGEIKLRPAYSFPVWPYASIGLDYVFWWIREKDKTAQDGGTFGFHGAFGILLSLNWLDRGASQKLEHSAGITNTSLFAHFRLEKIDDFGREKSFDLSDSRFEFGIMFEF